MVGALGRSDTSMLKSWYPPTGMLPPDHTTLLTYWVKVPSPLVTGLGRFEVVTWNCQPGVGSTYKPISGVSTGKSTSSCVVDALLSSFGVRNEISASEPPCCASYECIVTCADAGSAINATRPPAIPTAAATRIIRPPITTPWSPSGDAPLRLVGK